MRCECLTFLFVCASVFVPDQNAGAGQSAPRQHDVQLHQHLPDGGHQRAVESECWITVYKDVYLHYVCVTSCGYCVPRWRPIHSS